MSVLGFLIGTGIVWILSALVVMPLARAFTTSGRKTHLAPISGETACTEEQEIDTGNFILADVVVLTVAGLFLGLVLGWFFIGITWHARNWPGLIAFIVASLTGSVIHG